MTALPYRTLSKLPVRSGLLTRLISTNASLRVARPQIDYTKSQSAYTQRSYATRTPSKPKAHTGRTTAKKRTTTTTKAKSAAKPKKKPAKKTAKPKPKKVKKAPSATALKRKATQDRRELREKGLVGKEPKGLPDNAWIVYLTDRVKGSNASTSVGDAARTAATQFKSLSPAERENLNHTANENKAKNEQAYKRWVGTFTPLQVKEANNARNILLRKAKAAKVKHLAPYRAIKDDRLVKHTTSAHASFLKDRFSSGDYKGMTNSEAFKLIGREFKALSGAEKKTYEDRAAADRTRYISEYKTVYGVDPPLPRVKATT